MRVAFPCMPRLSRDASLQDTCTMIAVSLGEPNEGEGTYGPVFWVSKIPSIAYSERAPAVARDRGSSMHTVELGHERPAHWLSWPAGARQRLRGWNCSGAAACQAADHAPHCVCTPGCSLRACFRWVFSGCPRWALQASSKPRLYSPGLNPRGSCGACRPAHAQGQQIQPASSQLSGGANARLRAGHLLQNHTPPPIAGLKPARGQAKRC